MRKILVLLVALSVVLTGCMSTSEGTDTSLIYAAWDGNVAEVKALIAAGVDLEVKDSEGSTALLIASYSGHTETVEVLLEAGADVKVKDNDGNTALSWACRYEYTEILVDVLMAIAISDAKDILSVYTLAQGDNLLENMKLLQKALDSTMMAYILSWELGIDLDVADAISNSAIPVLLLAESCNANGANALLDERFQAIVDGVKVLDKNDYESTLKCYAVLSEYKNLLQDTSGSLNEFNAAKTRLNSEFQQAMALAILE